MRVLFVDGSSGASGDMLLGALVDLGLPVAALRRALAGLPVAGGTQSSRRLVRCGLAGRKVDVRVRGRQPHRGLHALERIVERGGLSPSVRDRAFAVFRRLVEAEAEVHGLAVDRTHLHEAGGTDAVIDVVGVCWGLERLGVERLVVSPLTTGFGTVVCQHGTYPVPAPATLLLMRGLPIEAGGLAAERLTPTGAALLTTLADGFGPMPAMRPSRVGYGAGDREFDSDPNYLRAVLGDLVEPTPYGASGSGTEVEVIEATVDDMTPQGVAHAAERLREAGALDVFTTAVVMKKGRSGHLLTVLCRPERFDAIARCVIEQTTSLGLRHRRERRIELGREIVAVRTAWGVVRVKRAWTADGAPRVMAEYDDCARLARERGVTLAEVQRAAIEAARRGAAGQRKRRNDQPRRRAK
ncbi:MAG TPA: nickel pincer cofactor biosynthesis protein LarC [Candidatus Polarisedimenticolaceae bacterium]|nr:nickel pincer cofactor biosynthesis protein LarC [Candidatus Polarisedimenticolaceae bacterium]